MTRFITIASGKGGVGKTTVAINLATALSDFGRSIILVDGSLESPDIGLFLGAPVVKTTLHDVLAGEASIREAVYSHPSGIKVIPGSISIDKSRGVSPEKLGLALMGINDLTEAVIIDSPSGYGKDTIAAIRSSDEVIIVTNPDLPSVTDSLKTVKLAEKIGTKVCGVIVNRNYKGAELSIENIENLLERRVIGVIPEDYTIKTALKLKHPSVYSHPDCQSTVAFRRIAGLMIGQEYKESIPVPEKKGFISFIRSKVNKNG